MHSYISLSPIASPVVSMSRLWPTYGGLPTSCGPCVVRVFSVVLIPLFVVEYHMYSNALYKVVMRDDDANTPFH